jgi:copper(I)-binding protein
MSPLATTDTAMPSPTPALRPRRGRCTTVALVTAAGLTFAVAACGGAGSTAPAAATSAATAPTSSSAVAGLSLTDGWIKSAPTGMTAIFGTLTNTTGHDITVMSGTTPVAAMVQLHEVVTVNGTSKMQPKAGGFLIPAHGSHELKPGGDHVMLMGLKQPIKAGDMVTATLSLKDGSSVAISAIGKDFAGANESYGPSGSSMAAAMSMSPGASMVGGMHPSTSPSS